MSNNRSIDFIGDIHGHAYELVSLLNKLGYSKKNGTYTHPERIAFFVGDYIDRGPYIPETLNIVRRMTDSGSAKAIMGNHEYNAICFNERSESGMFLREHSIKNILQHSETLKQFRHSQKEYDEYIEWFKTLPLYYESDNFRAVHASWDSDHIELLGSLTKDRRLTGELLKQSAEKNTDIYNAVDVTLKGKELRLPGNIHFSDKDDNKRREMRIKWWEDATRHTWQSLAVGLSEGLPETPVETEGLSASSYYREEEKPVFFGHYWLSGNPSLYRSNICCLDYSVAKQGKLVAYRFDGEEQLSNEKLVFV